MAQATEMTTIPTSIRWRPMPAKFDIKCSTLPVCTMTPDTPVPCRRCLNMSTVGDEMIPVSYDPFLGDSPYRCASPIFLHANLTCNGEKDWQAADLDIPDQQRDRLLSARGYNSAHMLKEAEVVEGKDVAELCDQWLKNPELEYVRLHYARQGCFATRVERA